MCRFEKFVVQQSMRVRDLFESYQEEDALVLSTRLVDMIDRRSLGVMRGAMFEIVPEAFIGSAQIERRLRPRWRCVYQGQSVVVRARSQREAQYEAAQVLLTIESIECGLLRDGRQIVPSYV